MEALDLTRQGPEEYQGKLVECNGREYLVGKHLGTGAERIVHQLINRKSNLCLHVLKIVRLQCRPIGLYTEEIAKVRSTPEFARIVPVTLVVAIPGGIAELQANLGAIEDEGSTISDLLKEGDGALGREDWRQAVILYERVLEANPFHTMAIINLAAAYHGLGDLNHACQLAIDAVAIEPNFLLYREGIVKYLALNGNICLALREFSKTKRFFANVFDLDEFGADLFLASGDPQSAEPLAQHAILDSAEKERLKHAVGEAITAKTRASELLARAKETV